jgi:hypothetical protein
MVANDLGAGVAGSSAVAHRSGGARSTFLENIMPTVYTEVEVDVDLDDFSDDDLLDEIDRRGLGAEASETTATEIITAIWLKRRMGCDYQAELEQLIYQTIGKVI